MVGQQYRHILYYSPSHIDQLFVDLFGETTHIVEEKETQWSNRIKVGLEAIMNLTFGGEKQSRKNVMKSINQSEEHIQTKKVVNELLDDESIPRLRDLKLDKVSSLYRFSCECQLLPVDNEDEFGDENLVEVVGKEGDFKFRGITSLDNWSSLSDTLYAVRNEIPYPLDGIVQLRDINDKIIREEGIDEWVLDHADCDVNYIFICQSDRDEMQKWWNRHDLMKEYYKKVPLD